MPYMCEVERGTGGTGRSLVELMIDACRLFVETSCSAQKFFIEHEVKKSSGEKMENKIASKGKIKSTSSLQKIFFVVNLLINRFCARTISRLNEIKRAVRRSLLDEVMNVGMGRACVCVYRRVYTPIHTVLFRRRSMSWETGKLLVQYGLEYVDQPIVARSLTDELWRALVHH